MSAIDTLLDGLIDFAGLYPPASLDMQSMVERWAMSVVDDEAWLLSRVLVPIDQLDAGRAF